MVFHRGIFVMLLIPMVLGAQPPTTFVPPTTIYLSRATDPSTVGPPNTPFLLTELTNPLREPVEKQQNPSQPPPEPFLDIVFDSQYHVVFGKHKLSLFHNCLCSNKTELCAFTIVNDTTTRTDYKTVGGVIGHKLKTFESNGVLSTTFLCDGQFFDGSMKCSRKKIEFDGLLEFSNNKLFNITFSNTDCDVDEVSILCGDLDYSVEIVTERVDEGDQTSLGTTTDISVLETSQTTLVSDRSRTLIDHTASPTSGPTDPGHTDSKSIEYTRIYVGSGVGGSAALILIVLIALCWKCEWYERVIPANSKLRHNSTLSFGKPDKGASLVSDKVRIITDNDSVKSAAGDIELQNTEYFNETNEEERGSHYVNFKQLQAFFGSQSGNDAEETAVDPEEVYGNSEAVGATMEARTGHKARSTLASHSTEDDVSKLQCESVYGNIQTLGDPDCEYVAVDELTEMRRKAEQRDITNQDRNSGLRHGSNGIQDGGDARLSHNQALQAEELTSHVSQVQDTVDTSPLKLHSQPKRSSEPRSLQLRKSGGRDLSRKTKSVYTRLSIGRDGAPQVVEDSLDGPYNTASGQFDTFIEQKRKASLAQDNNFNAETAANDRVSFPQNQSQMAGQDGSMQPEQTLYFDLEDSEHLAEDDIYDNDVIDERQFEDEEDTTTNVYFELETGIDDV